MTKSKDRLDIANIASYESIKSLLRYFSKDTLWSIYTYGLSIGQSVRQVLWSNDDHMAIAEDRFLRCLKNKYYRYYVEVPDNCKIWTLSSVPPYKPNISPARNTERPAIVMLHGFIAGLAFWVMNFDSIVDAGYDLYAFDIPGYARSTRINFSDDENETEKIFVDSFENWRKAVGLKHIIIIGHSFGGYLTCAYSLAYPQYVSQIILADPWGFPDLREEVTQVIESGSRSAIAAPLLTLPVWLRLIVLVLLPFSPFSFVRLAGRHIGPKIIQNLRPDMTRRYASIFGDDDQTTVSDYIFQTNKFKPTGEDAFRSMTLPLAWAKKPMIKRIGDMDKNILMTFIYGSRSWIDYRTGFEVRKLRPQSSVNVHVINGAGHHLFADAPEQFNSLILRIAEGSSTSDLSYDTIVNEQNSLIRDNLILD